MKRLLSITFYLLSFTLVLAQGNFTITGTLSNDSLRFTKTTIKKVYLKRTIGGEEVIVDSAEVKKGKFKFKGVAPEFVEMASISGFDNGSIFFLLEEGDIVIPPFSAQFPVAARVGGTKNSEIFTNYMALVSKNGQDSRKRMDAMIKSLPEEIANDSEKFFPYQYSVYHGNSIWYKIDVMNYLLEHFDSEASLYMIRHGLYQMFSPKVIERQFLRAVPQHLRKHPVYEELWNRLLADNLKEGSPAPNIKGLTPEGKSLSLADFKGKYVLLDFWASWCGPCRREFPYMHEALKASENAENFVILSYSIDSKHADWVNCIEKNNLKHKNWYHISTLKGWNSEGARLYGVDGVPYTVLLNPEGKVISFELRGEEMVNKIANFISCAESYE